MNRGMLPCAKNKRSLSRQISDNFSCICVYLRYFVVFFVG